MPLKKQEGPTTALPGFLRYSYEMQFHPSSHANGCEISSMLIDSNLRFLWVVTTNSLWILLSIFPTWNTVYVFFVVVFGFGFFCLSPPKLPAFYTLIIVKRVWKQNKKDSEQFTDRNLRIFYLHSSNSSCLNWKKSSSVEGDLRF